LFITDLNPAGLVGFFRWNSNIDYFLEQKIPFSSSCIALIFFFQHMLLAAIVLSITTIIVLRFIKSKKND